MNQAILHDPKCWVVIRLWARRAIDLGEIVFLAVLKQWIPNGIGIADKANAAGSDVMNMATSNERPPIVVVAENRVAADLIEFTVHDADVFGAGQYKRAAAIDRPITAEQLFFAIHECPRGVADRETFE